MPDSVDDRLCGSCGQDLTSDGDHSICRLCSRKYHFGECSIKRESWKGLGKNGQKSWACGGCRIKTRGSQSQDDTDEISVLDINSKLDKMLEMRSSIDEISKSISFLSSKYDEMTNDLRKALEENATLKKDVKELKKKESKNEEMIKNLSERLNDLDRYGRRVNLEIFGVQIRGQKFEEEDTTSVVKELSQKIGVAFKNEDIHKLHRLQPRNDGRPSAIIVQFMSGVTRDKWLQAGKKARLEDGPGNKVFFNENLIASDKILLKQAKVRAKLHNYRYVWFKHGKIFVRKHENAKNVIVIKTLEDLDKLV